MKTENATTSAPVDRLVQRRFGPDTIDQRGVAFICDYGYASLCWGSKSQCVFQFCDRVAPMTIEVGDGVRCDRDAIVVGTVDGFKWPMFSVMCDSR